MAAFAVSTMFIAVPTGVKILNWLATMWGGKLTFSAPMLYSIGLVTMFTIGGLSGVTHAVAPSDTQQTDTYYIVAHFHYVLFGGALFGFIGGWYFWWPKVFGYALERALGKINFWILLVGFNLTFGPMHILGLQGMPRRTYTYRDGYGFNFWNFVATIGAFIIAVCVLIFFWNIWQLRAGDGRAAGTSPMSADPWDARSLEWMIQSPTPVHNFDVDARRSPSLDEFWHRKYGEDEDGRLVAHRRHRGRRPEGRRGRTSTCRRRRTGPSCWPSACRSSATASSTTSGSASSARCFVIAAIYGWVMEPSTDPDAAATPTTRRPRDARATTAAASTWSAELETVPMTDVAVSGRGTRGSRHPAHDEGHVTSHRHLQREAGHVGVPRLGVPAVRRP